MTTGEKIRSRRRALHMTQGELARQCGLSAITISRYEEGNREIRLNDLVKIASVLRTDVSSFVSDPDENEIQKECDAVRKEITALLPKLDLASLQSVLEYTQYILHRAH